MRVIAGSLRGRVLRAPRGSQTRPTADRVKEALFSILGPLDAFNVLDLYAGTGSLGIEALSRGARQAVFIEAARDAVLCLQQNLSSLKIADRSHIVPMRVERSTREIANWAPYDLAFCDPPWPRIDEAWKFLSDANVMNLFSPTGRLVLEHPANHSPQQDVWAQMQVVCVRAWGDSAVTVLERSRAEQKT